ncbi:hypothetical protein JXA40_03940 [bacterium]|nr:hypothetical protein [candidate division CSSED10-310 bacterium]
MVRKRAVKTSYLFPARGVISVVEVPRESSQDRIAFSMLEINFGDDDRRDFPEIHRMLRLSYAVSLTQAPGMFTEEDPDRSNLVLSFHSNRPGAERLEDPIMIMVLPLDTVEDADILETFNGQIEVDGYFTFAVQMKDYVLFLAVAEVFSVAPPFTGRNFQGALSVFSGEFRYFGEFMPGLQSAVDGIVFALDHYHRLSKPAASRTAVNMTGLIPEGLA